MTQNTGTTVIAPIVTPDTNDKFPTHINSMGKGGYHSVYDLSARDALPLERREEGMLVGVILDNTVYQLIGGIDNAFWTIFAKGAGGATTASDLAYSPTGALIATNVQAGIDELELKKANILTTYSKVEVDNKITNHSHDYNTLTNLPDLSKLHDHTNNGTLDLFSQILGELAWNGKTVGTMVADIYDVDSDGIIDKAKTLDGLTATTAQLNYSTGLTGNIQAQINALSSGTVFKGEYSTWANMLVTLPSPSKGFWVFITADETKGGAKTQYYHDGTDWIYGGGAANTPVATDTILGGIKLAGVLANPLGTADSPLLAPTGVVPGLYKAANVNVGEDGRISYIEEGATAFINDTVVSATETWSSDKINDGLTQKEDKGHTHSQLHDANMLGDVPLDIATRSDKRVIAYNAVTGKAEWQESAGGKVYVGSKVIAGDYRLVAGSYVSLFIDEVAKTITINSTAGSGGAGVPTLTEITHTELVPKGQTVVLALDAAFNKFDIRTVEALSPENVVMDLQVFDSSASNKRRVYLSNKETYIYDIANVPVHDKDQSQKLHIAITNYGTIDANISLVINTTNLI